MKYYQEWNNVIFLHWQVELDLLTQFVPSGIEIDMFEGKPWVSVVAFTIEGIRPSYLPSFSPISKFDEINVRTYTKYGGKAGVTFLSIEAGNRLSALVARKISRLPYRFSEIGRTDKMVTSKNESLGDRLLVEYTLGEAQTEKTPLDLWLTERYALFQDDGSMTNVYDVHHEEWPLRHILVDELIMKYPRYERLLAGPPQLSHYSSGVRVVAQKG